MQNKKGKFIVLYGINNLGKSTQAKFLVEKLNSINLNSEYIKYPIYNLSPSGNLLNDYLRGGNFHKLSAREAQIIYTLNRTQYQKIIEDKLNQGINIVAEDYTGTGIAWGMGAGVEENFLKYINNHLLKENLAILLDGHRFTEAIEQKHKHETNNELTNQVRLAHLKLAQEYDWKIINANQSIKKINYLIWKNVQKIFKEINETDDLENIIKSAYPTENKKIQVTQINKVNSSYLDIKQQDANPRIITNTPTTSLPLEIRNNQKQNFQIKIQKITADAKLPNRAHPNDAGLDIYANENCTIYENEIYAIGTGIKISLPNGYASLIWDKSGMALRGLHTIAGVIDADYRGEYKIVLHNISGDIIHIAKGQKIAQVLIQKVESPKIIETKNLNETSRNDGRFGSTGIF